MSNEMITQLPNAVSANLTDIIYAVQGFSPPSSNGTSVQETLAQVAALMLANTILSNAGNPNGVVAGSTFQLCWDTVHNSLYVCTTSGTASTAVWTIVSASSGLVTPANGGTGVSNPTAHGIAIGQGSSNFNFPVLLNGQLLIGSTGADPAAAVLTAGSGITITNNPGSITISGTAASVGWNVVTTNTSMTANSGYFCNAGSNLTMTLPTTATVGSIIIVSNYNTGGFSIAQNAGQNIRTGTAITTTGVAGSVASTAQGDSIYLVCVVANTSFMSITAPQGNLIIT